ncbi:SGNH/GDSL hydrolase family protein [Mycobacterium vicinigordonae]|uniref:SGNH/GDSL hydrolase family protein n=2 Tax=Mycobacterium vicinigordonae TaxID=1719132 RepID=A0A7D6E618_9MYCO|nr:GDSL lipase [Mycobacterium vicinigordonae]QLL09986.1 SGNH/GDSL hydrolase family protein [Mycobacterium vicinigordonae]
MVPVAVLAQTPLPSANGSVYRPMSFDFRVNHVAVIGDSYTTGTDEGGLGSNAWTARAWQQLAQRGTRVSADVAAEGRAGYGAVGDHGHIFFDLTARAVRPEDVLVMFFGSRNDQDVDPGLLTDRVRDTLNRARDLAPAARLLVIGPPWPSADVPQAILRIRDILHAAARTMGAAFVDPLDRRWFVDRPDLIGADGVHPTDTGHAYMARQIAPLIRTQLSR